MPATARGRRAAPSGTRDVALPDVVIAPGPIASSPALIEPDVDALVVPLAPPADGDTDPQPRGGTADVAARYGIDLSDLAERVRATGAAGDAHSIELPRPAGSGLSLPWAGLPHRLVLVGIGGGEPADLRRAGAAVAMQSRGLRTVVTTAAAGAGADGVRAFVEGYLLAAYRHPTRATGPSAPAPAERLVLLGEHPESALKAARVTARATWTARELTVMPSDTKNPPWLADRAVALAEEAGLEVEVLGPAELAAHGFGGILAVGAGSATPPRLVVVRYTPPPRRSGPKPAHVVIVGKGITYDTGGLSIKAREAMVPMKTDMAGAAVALATVVGAAAAGVTHRVTALLPLAENAFGGASYRPSDVLRLHGGTTVEVTNTDAEGRLVLADALAYADLELEPDVLIDVATLTGAATMALGRTHGALFSSDDSLARALDAAGRASGERLWRMPLVEEYRSSLDSDVADIRHVAAHLTGAGAVVAALFLQHFVGTRRWVHLDVAGPARASSAAHEVPEGATGFGARLLLRWLAGPIDG